MALVRKFTEVGAERNAVHEDVKCGWRVFTRDGETILQLDTYGREGRKNPGKVSQTIQLNRKSGEELGRIIRRAFPSNT